MGKKNICLDTTEHNFEKFFIDQLDTNSDLECVLIGQAFLERMLFGALELLFVVKKFIPQNYQGICDLAYGIGLIPQDAHHNLTMIGRIRNTFAHLTEQISFNTPKVIRLCNELTIPIKSKSARDKYIGMCGLLIQRIDVCCRRKKMPEPKPWHPKRNKI